MNILVINAGSSSLKYQLLNPDDGKVYAKGNCERIGIDGLFTYKPQVEGKKKIDAIPYSMPTHGEAIDAVLKALIDPENGVLKSLDEIDAVGHRVLNGGDRYIEPVLIDDAFCEAIKECFPLAPLHNPANLLGINACRKAMPNVPHVAVFDTAFHQTMPPKAYIYALPYKYYREDHMRRYGAHGTSHRYVSHRCAEILGKDIKDLKIVTCHLGNGSSLAAVDHGRCVDTSMGLTPLAGLPMGTRSGDVDTSIIGYIMNKEHLTIDEMLTILNKKSGVLGISELSSDFRDLDKAAAEGNKQAALAIEIFEYAVHKMIGSYAAAMNGVDAVVFTAGVGENSPSMREHIAEGLEFMGIKIDPKKNDCHGVERIISTDDSKVKVLVIPTNEELLIAKDTKSVVEKK